MMDEYAYKGRFTEALADRTPQTDIMSGSDSKWVSSPYAAVTTDFPPLVYSSS